MKNNILFICGAIVVAAFVTVMFGTDLGLGVGTLGMAVGTRFFSVNDPNVFDAKGIKSGNDRADGSAIPYAATINMAVPTRKALRHYYDFALLTGALTVNFPDVTQFNEGDEIYMQFVVDATGRTVTWGTNIRPGVAGTFAMTASQVGLVKAVFMNSKIHILSQTSGAA